MAFLALGTEAGRPLWLWWPVESRPQKRAFRRFSGSERAVAQDCFDRFEGAAEKVLEE